MKVAPRASRSEAALTAAARGVAGHRPRVAQAQVEVAAAVHVLEVGALAARDEQREPARPADHPAHGHAGEQRALGALEERARLRVLAGEELPLAAEGVLQAAAIDVGHAGGVKEKTSGAEDNTRAMYTRRSTMRLTENEIEFISRKIVKTLVAEGKLEVDDPGRVTAGIMQVITDELRVEDALNEEVRQTLLEHTQQMERSDITYSFMFNKVKRELAKKKGIIL